MKDAPYRTALGFSPPRVRGWRLARACFSDQKYCFRDETTLPLSVAKGTPGDGWSSRGIGSPSVAHVDETSIIGS